MSPEISRFLAQSGNDTTPCFSPEHIKDLEDGTYVLAKQLMLHWTVIRGYLDDTISYSDRWCFATKELALKALNDFPVCPPARYEPEGWHRHPKSGRRRHNTSPDFEYIDP